MSRPVRSAAIRARELFQAGFRDLEADEDERGGLSSWDEDESDGLLSDKDESEEEMEIDSDDSGGRTSGGNEGHSERYLSYDDPDVQPEVAAFTPRQPPGLSRDIAGMRRVLSDLTREVDFFRLFFTPVVMQMIVDGTNVYGNLNILQKQSYATISDGSWKDVTIDELDNFLALVIFMGFTDRHELWKYWAQVTLYSGGWAPRFLSRNRFKAILGMIHITDPMDEDPQDKLTKVRPLINEMRSACSSVYCPRKELSVDERMIAFKGRSEIRQYIPSKPTRFGFKVWCICEAKTGYTSDFRIYTGKRERPSSHGSGYDVVVEMVEKFKNQGYAIFFDNYFTSIPLMKCLKENGLNACGTTLTTRRGFPQCLKNTTWNKKTSKNEVRWQRSEDVLCMQWVDKKPVYVCSTYHSANDYVDIRRNAKNKEGKWQRFIIKKPLAIHDYNQYMGGVDLSDQLLERYSVILKSYRWWKTIFFHLLDLAIVNSYIIFESWRAAHPENIQLQRHSRYSHLSFREELVRQLAQISEEEEPPLYQLRRQTPQANSFYVPHMPQASPSRRNCYVCYSLHKKQQKTSWMCSEPACNIPLCLNLHRNCYKLWHSEQFEAQRDRMDAQ